MVVKPIKPLMRAMLILNPPEIRSQSSPELRANRPDTQNHQSQIRVFECLVGFFVSLNCDSIENPSAVLYVLSMPFSLITALLTPTPLPHHIGWAMKLAKHVFLKRDDLRSTLEVTDTCVERCVHMYMCI
jgi:1-acyl-sn-glycerol-3-phosphate acyltransferase